MRRRDFLTLIPAAGVAAALPRAASAAAGTIRSRASQPLKILFLGGTNFVGPAIVELALERGHEVTLFNRHVTHPWLYTHLERLRGNRYPDRDAGLDPLRGSREWDAVIDTWQDSPVAVELTAKLLQERVGFYAYISSIAVYQGSYGLQSFDETAELPSATMPDTIDVELPYPKRKQLGERAVARAFPARHGIFRAYGIVGPDARGRLDIDDVKRGLAAAYWPIRLRRGGHVLAPGDGADRTQWTGLRDLADFVVHAVENRLGGAYNVSQKARFREFLGSLAALSPSAPELVWVPAEFLFERGIRSFVDVPGWVSRTEEECCFYHASTEKARAAGFRPRQVRQVYRPIVDAFLRHHADFDFRHPEHGVELARREEELLAGWRRSRLAG